MDNDLIILGELKRMNAEEIHRVFFSKVSDHRCRLEKTIKEIWKLPNSEDCTLIIISFLQYLTNNGCEVLNEMYNSCTLDRKLDFPSLFVIRLGFYLTLRSEFKNERKHVYNALIDIHNSTDSWLALKKSNELKAYLWGDDGKMYDSDIQQATDSLNTQLQLEIPIKAQTIKEELRKALCIHPEMILCSYDYSDTLDNWRKKTVKQRLSQIGDILIIKHLLNHDPKVTQEVFFSSDSKYRPSIDQGIKESWGLGDEDLPAVVNSYVYDLIVKNNSSKMKLLKKKIARDIPYIPLPLSTTLHMPKKWKRYEDGDLCTLLQESAHTYADERSEFKEERTELQRLFKLSPDERKRGYSQGNYDSKIEKEVRKKKKKYKAQIDADVIKMRFKHFMCDALHATLARYDFQQELSQWLKAFTDNIIEDLIKIQILMDENGAKGLLDKEFRSFIQKKAEKIYINGTPLLDNEGMIDDLLQELFIILWADDKKVLYDFQFNARLKTYINSVAYHYIMRLVQLKKQEIGGMAKLKTKRVSRKVKKENYTLKLKTNSIKYKALITILKNPDHRKLLHDLLNLHTRISTTQNLQLRILEELYVNLTEFTSKEQRCVRQRLIEEFYSKKPIAEEQYSIIEKRRGGNNNLLSQHEKRAKNLIEKVEAEITRIIQSNSRSPQEEALLKDYEQAVREAIYSQLKQEPNE